MKRNLLFLLTILPLFTHAQINTAKPWAYWWWLGSAVNERDISKNLEDFAQAGFGGMHIIPIFGVKGEEANFIPYLSPKWVNMLDFTVKEAQRLGLGIDMTLGTGWPLGGAHVADADAAKSFKINKLGDKYVLEVIPTKQKVKRAAPGAEGWVLDHFDTVAVNRYFHPFDSIFNKKNIGVRAFYNDSYEVYGANWTTDFFKKFKILRGYDLAEHLDVLAKDTAITAREKRIWSDYHETLSDLLVDFTKTFNQFSHKKGKITRNESHGSPANVLDLYAENDVPETEFFGSKPFNIPLYRQDPDYEIKRFGVPGDLVLKLASSAANVSGRRLVSSETATWLGNHFKVSLSQVKPIVDESFIGGVNHIFFHGVPYSPPDAPFPGWLFYASTNFNQKSHFWNALPQLNAYIEQCQKRLQNSKPDNDILLYFPMFDTWQKVGKNAKMHWSDVHNFILDNISNTPFGNTVRALQSHGFAFDFISDKQLIRAKTSKNLGKIGLNTVERSEIPNTFGKGGTSYKTVVVPRCDNMPLATLEALARFKKAGVNIVFVDKLPDSVNGFFNAEIRQIQFDKLLKLFQKNTTNNLTQTLENQQVRHESMTEKGLTFIRKKTENSTLYFIANQNKIYENGTIRLEAIGESVKVFNPLFPQKESLIAFKKIGKNAIEIPLELASGESIFVEIFNKKTEGIVFDNSLKKSVKIEKILRGPFQIDFIKGDPALPQNFKTDTLQSWTILSKDTMSQYFSGTARYTLNFNILEDLKNKKAYLDLGDVREFATVKLNGISLGTAWCLPFKLLINQNILKKENNILEIEVTNLSANRIRYLDKKGVYWKKFYDINFVDIGYRPFDASNWESVLSGLLGDVKLVFDTM
jgi:alpha-L-rhamnosidase